MIEPFTKSLLIGMATTGQTITKNTSVSIALVIAIIAATSYVTSTIANTGNDISNLQQDVEDIKDNQKEILKYIQGVDENMQSAIIDTISDYEFLITE